MNPDYPHTATVEQVDDYHGTKVADPHRWLEDPDAPAVREWIAAQNRITQEWLGSVTERPAIRARLAELWDHPRAGVPWRRGGRWFQMRNTGLQNQDVLWTMDGPSVGDAAGRVLLDPNAMSAEGTVSLSAAAVSEDGALLAYATSTAGSDWMTWRVRDVASGEDRHDELAWSKFAGAAWTHDGAGFFYARFDAPAKGQDLAEANRVHQLRYHRLGDDQADDALVYVRPDEPDWILSPSVTQDGRWLVVHVSEGTDPRTRVWVAELGVDDGPRPLLDDLDAAYHLVGTDGDDFYFLTDHDAPRKRIIALDVRAPTSRREVVAEDEDTLERARLVGGRLVVARLHHARNRLRLHDLDGTPGPDVALPDIATVSSVTGRADDDACYVGVVTHTQPQAIYRIDVATEDVTLVRSPSLDVDSDAFVAEQVFVDRPGGVRVPMFLVRRADVEPDGGAPLRLYGYGGFNISLTPGFSVAGLVWLELGGVLAMPNLRGGGEYGKSWHDAGRLANKQTVFDDAIACAEWLIDAGWTRPERLAIQGGSNGGLLVGACMTQRPDLFGACVPEVGVLDMLRFHRFTIGWAWTSDYGSPDEPEQFAWLSAYSPLHNLTQGTRYPATLITTGDHDDRVVPAHSFKFAAALQAAQAPDGPPVLIRIETDAGHGAGKPTAKLIDERADVFAFLVRALEMQSASGSLGS